MEFTVKEESQRETNTAKLILCCFVFRTRSSDPVDCPFIEYLIT